jgi:hypothetical protein
VSIPVDAKPPFTEDPAVPDYFDPLAYLIERAHRRGIAVHAWVPVTPFWNRDQPPKDPRHAWYLHGPQAVGDDLWLSVSNLGRTTTYVDPGNPGVMRYLADVIVDIPRHYNVDGIHLDYIRYPAGKGAAFDFGWNPGAVARFNRLYGATTVSRPAMTPGSRISAASRSPISCGRFTFEPWRSDRPSTSPPHSLHITARSARSTGFWKKRAKLVSVAINSPILRIGSQSSWLLRRINSGAGTSPS